jgi:ribose 5-phosphate isomerase A
MEAGKALAAMAAAEMARDGMGIGLGSGSTSAEFVRLLGQKVKKEKLRVECVPTSEDARLLALKAGLRVVGLDEVRSLDLAVDGADAVDRKLNLVKGGGGCHAREKVVAYAAKKFVCIVDGSKLRETLAGVPVPVEVLPFACGHVARTLEESWGAKAAVRRGGGKLGPVVTDNGNYIIDAVFKRIPDPCTLERELACVPGAVANGIFAARKPLVIVGRKNKAEIFKG